MRHALIVLGAAVFLLGAADPAAPPDYPVTYMKVDDIKAALDAGQKADLIDVRTLGEYQALHIKGARSIPLRTLPERVKEIPRRGLVVFY